jgi:DMSO/TMAO reductase YedYZ molybdopterin-dependent catalytic subunit
MQDEATPVDRFSWRIRVWGHVRESVEWSLDTLEALPPFESRFDDNLWQGLATRELLARVIPLPDVTYVMAHGDGDYRAGFSLATFAGPHAILAWSRNRQRLDAEHGGPLRLVVPGDDACKSVKWINGLEFLNKPWPDSLSME